MDTTQDTILDQDPTTAKAADTRRVAKTMVAAAGKENTRPRNVLQAIDRNVTTAQTSTTHGTKKPTTNSSNTFKIYEETKNCASGENKREQPSSDFQEQQPDEAAANLMVCDEADTETNRNVVVISDDEGLEVYEKDIHENAKSFEPKYATTKRYMTRHRDINSSMRSILVDWLAEVIDEYKMSRQTLHLAINYVDRFLTKMLVQRNRLQLVGTSAIFIASKFQEIYPPEINEFVYVTDETYQKKQIIRMEHMIMKVLDFNLVAPTVLLFLRYYLKKIVATDQEHHLAHYLCDLTLLDISFLDFKPSVIAASAVLLTRHTLSEGENDPEMEQVLLETSGYTLVELSHCLQALWGLHCRAGSLEQQSLQEKYALAKYDCVASIPAAGFSPAAMLDQEMDEASDSE